MTSRAQHHKLAAQADAEDAIDLRKMLKVYMTLVVSNEGTAFLGPGGSKVDLEGLTPAEWLVLAEIRDEVFESE